MAKKNSSGITKNPHIVRECIVNGKRRWAIADDFVITDEAELARIKERISRNAQAALTAAALAKQADN